MTRIQIPSTINEAPAASRPLLEAVKKQLGIVPNLFRLVANSPVALDGYLAKNVAKLDDAEITANRNGASNDPKADSAVRFAAKITSARGHISDADLSAVRIAGYDDAQIIEIVQHVALNTWTNYMNEVAGTDIDFPVVTSRAA